MRKKYHEPVLTSEVVDFLKCKSNGIYVDVTLGGGGWAKAILEATGPKGKLIGFDRDDDAIKESTERLNDFLNRFQAIKADFSEVGSELKELHLDAVDGIVADLGVSSYQLDEAQRGFSFSKDAKLDMRMDVNQEVTAYDLINESSAEDLANWFFEFGEERHSRRIAAAIVRERDRKPIETTGELADIVLKSTPVKKGRWKIHPATRIFQALRIVVNDELGELDGLLDTLPVFLSSGGRMIIVSYHSLEDRRVKQKFLELARTGDYKRVTHKPVRPAEEEVERNRRARSAKMRVLERL